jgi:threonylcarbamoyladenosine tRNA methylthiotransferase MtaB
MAEQLRSEGFSQAEPNEAPDIVVVNTCTVTREATKASRSALRRAARSHPKARVVAIGCYAVSDRVEVEAIDGVDLVCDNDDKERLAEALRAGKTTAPLMQIGLRRDGAPAAPSVLTKSEDTARPRQVRANLKVQTGCDEWCTFCIIPRTRGRLRSLDEDSLVREAEQKVQAGARELVLTGVHLGKYAYDAGGDERDLVRLLRRLLDIEGVLRLRLSSILSRHLTEEVIGFMATEPRICRYLHVPLQAGDDQVLETMHRPYRISEYVNAVERAKSALPTVALATDIIVGFPGETEEAFGATLEVVRRIDFSKLHVFRYSARPGTPAAEMPNAVAPDVKKERSKRLIELGSGLRRRFLERHLESGQDVLVEDRREVDGSLVCSGQTDDYVRVWFEGDAPLGNVVKVQPETIRADGIQGRLMPSG